MTGITPSDERVREKHVLLRHLHCIYNSPSERLETLLCQELDEPVAQLLAPHLSMQIYE